MSEVNHSRRQLLQKAVYAAPVVATLAVMPALAKAGSAAHCNNGVGNGPDCNPPGLINKPNLNNDDFGGVPGAPQNQGGTGGIGGNTLTTLSKRQHH